MHRTLTVRRYATLVASAGTASLLLTVLNGLGGAVQRRPAAFAILATLVVVTEWFPVRVTGTDRSGWFTVSLPFVIALIVGFGAGPAGLTVVAASVVADLRRHVPLLHTAFNAAQYSLAVAAGATAGTSAPVGEASPYLVVVLTGLAFVAVNNLLTSGVLLLDTDDPADALRGLAREAAMDSTLLLAAPVVVLVADRAPALLPVLLLPALAVYRGARLARRTEYEALHDHLTRLPNRELFRRRLAGELGRMQGGLPVGVGLIDLNDFRTINDTLGHHTGDRLLEQVAARLAQADLAGTEVARLGGDEFGLLITGARSPDEVRDAAHRVLSALREPFCVDGFGLEIDASIGVSVAPTHGDDVDTLLRCADIAMYSAKDTHAGVALYAPPLDTFSHERLRLLADLRGAIDNDEFVVHYQPKVDLIDGRVTGVEALVRWQHPELGLLSPGAFIPLAERTSHIDALTMAIIDASLAQHCRWRSQGLLLPVAVNVAPHTLLGPDFAEQIGQRLEHHGAPGTALEVEITEGTIMRDKPRAAAALCALRRMGVRVAIDDFGTGYGSLSYLRDLPVDVVKIDRAFVAAVHCSEGDRAIVESTVALAHRMAKHTVAEGLEEAEGLAVLRAAGCDEVQGYLFGRPQPADHLTAWLRAYTPFPSPPVPSPHGSPARGASLRRIAS